MSRKRTKDRVRQRTTGRVEQSRWRTLENRYPPFEILREEQLDAIHDTSLSVLEDFGIEFRNASALELLEQAGANVDYDSQLVRFDRGLIAELIALAPSEFTLHARNPERNVVIGGRNLCFDSVGGPPNSADVVSGRRMGTFEECCRFFRLAQSLNVLHIIGGWPIAPTDLNAETRHLDCTLALLTLTDKVWFANAIGAERVEDALEMLRIALGLDHEQLLSTPCTFSVINVNSPRRYDEAMADGLMELARNGQANCITPFTLCGAMSPITLAGGLAQQNAEVLAGVALTQIVRPGAPVIYGGFTSNVDMKTGSPAFGTPEYTKACVASGQLARRYGLPYRSSNTNASNAVDAQAAYESSMSIWGSVLGHCNLLHHAVGWLEGGLTASFEKAIVDAEMLQMMAAFLDPIEVNEDTLALKAIGDVEPGGHFFGSEHTLSRYEDAFYKPLMSDWRNFETWSEAGGEDATQRANKIWKKLLEEYEQPALDTGIQEELEAFVSRRKAEFDSGVKK
jgi:trimethylamine--corrinoid protein Co-methyltransferase